MDTLAINADPFEALARRLLWTGAFAQVLEPDAPEAVAQPQNEREEESLIALRVFQDPSAIEILYDRYYARILNYLYRRTMDRDLAEDLTSRTFLQAFEALRRVERSVWVCPWLYRIATNVHISHMRSWGGLRRRMEEIGRHWLNSASRQVRPDNAASQQEEQVRLRECLQSIPAHYRAVIMLRFDEQLAHAEIAQVLGLSESAVRQRLARGLRMLEACYGESDPCERPR